MAEGRDGQPCTDGAVTGKWRRIRRLDNEDDWLTLAVLVEREKRISESDVSTVVEVEGSSCSEKPQNAPAKRKVSYKVLVEESLKEMRDCIEHTRITLASIDSSRNNYEDLNSEDLAVVKPPKHRLSLQELLTDAKECLRIAENDGTSKAK